MVKKKYKKSKFVKRSGVKKGKKVTLKEVHEDFSSYGERIDKLKSLERELKVLDPQGFAVEEKIIKSKLKDPTAIPELERRLSKLKKKMLGKHRKKSPVVKIGKNILHLQNLNLKNIKKRSKHYGNLYLSN